MTTSSSKQPEPSPTTGSEPNQGYFTLPNVPPDYNSNQVVPMTATVPMPEGWGSGEMKLSMEPCQEVVRQVGYFVAKHQSESTETIDNAGIQTHTVSQMGAEAMTTPTQGSGTPPTTTPAATETGLATGMEDKVAEAIEQSFGKLKDLLKDLNVKATVKKAEDGSVEFHIRNENPDTGIATSEEELPCEILPQYKVKAIAQASQYSGENALVQEPNDKPFRVAAFGLTGTPTQESDGNDTINADGDNGIRQNGFQNICVAVQTNIVVNFIPLQTSIV